MTLDAYLQAARQTGHARYRVQSPRGYELCRGEIADVEAKVLEALCAEDASELVRGKLHEYVVTLESADGTKTSRRGVKVPGGREAESDGVPDAMQLMGKQALDANVTRLAIAAMNALVAQNRDLTTERAALYAQLGRTQREAMRSGKWDVEREKVRIDAEERKRDSEQWKELASGLAPMGTALLARLSPAGKDAAWAKFRSELTDAQLAKFAEVLGPVRLAKLLAMPSADKACAFLIDGVSPEEAQALSSVLSEGQQQVLGAVVQEEMQRRAKANGQGAAAGAPS